MRIKNAIAVILGGLVMILCMGLSHRKQSSQEMDQFDDNDI